MKLWDKGTATNRLVEEFTTGNDRDLDLLLAPWDILGSMAHVQMLLDSKLLKEAETKLLIKELENLYHLAIKGELQIEDEVEDIHSQIEKSLTLKLGEAGEKIHTARSRNDQVLLDIRLFTRDQIGLLTGQVKELFDLLIEKSEANKDLLMPGYTHLQVALPSSFGLWFGAFAESLTDDLILLSAAYRIVNQNPLGSAAGYGSGFPIDRKQTTLLLGFGDLVWNSVYAQMGRGKVEKTVAFALSSVAATLSKLATDAILFMNQNFNFIHFPDSLTTGSSIMPHKKNPDVLELIRAKCNNLQALPNDIALITTNLPGGYHRDFQLLKERFLPAFEQLFGCIQMTKLMLSHIKVHKRILEDQKYEPLFSVEEINRKVKEGVPFRQAYREVAASIAKGTFHPEKTIRHIHEGSIGNPGNDAIKKKMDKVLKTFDFQTTAKAIQKLVKETE